MTRAWLWAAMLPLFLAAGAAAQPRLPALPVVPVPEALPAPAPLTNADTLPAGTEVSRPLQPVVIPAPSPAPQEPPAVPVEDVVVPPSNLSNGRPMPLGRSWNSLELLVWWPKAYALPPLVTGSRGGNPALGRPGTTTLLGGDTRESQDHTGGRFTLGYALDSDATVGLEGTYFFLGTRTTIASATDANNARARTLGIPFVNAVTGDEDAIVLAAPGVANALVTASASARVQGAELNLVAGLIDTPTLRVTGLAGYRFLQVHEGFRLGVTRLQAAGPDAPQTLTTVADQFDAHNRFSGGQLGVQTDFVKGPVFVEVLAKLALGRSFEVVRTDGLTHRVTAGVPLPGLASFPGGVFVLPSNGGRLTDSTFAVVPETTFKVGLQSKDRGRVFVGYNFLYLSNAVRPGDQIDRTLNPGQVPLLNPDMQYAGPDRPLSAVRRGDFWAQGLVVGLEGRY